MSEEFCPNCRSRRSSERESCEYCGWAPLRSTEMLFVDREHVVCPNCSAKRPIDQSSCPHCGTHQLLESLSDNTQNFRISSLLLLTTLVGICLALCRISLALGIPAIILSSLASTRTVILIAERKRHRYPVVARDIVRLFLSSLGGILVGVFVFGACWIFGAMLFGGIAGGLMFGNDHTVLLVLTVFLAGTHAVAAVMVCQRVKKWRACLKGAVLALGAGGVVVILCAGIRHDAVMWMSWLPIGTFIFGGVRAASQREGAHHTKAYLIGHSSMISLIGLILFAYGDIGTRDVAAMFMMSGLLLLPILLAILTLQSIWSWDDAFPKAISHMRPDFARQPVSGHAADEGIVIIEEAK